MWCKMLIGHEEKIDEVSGYGGYHLTDEHVFRTNVVFEILFVVGDWRISLYIYDCIVGVCC